MDRFQKIGEERIDLIGTKKYFTKIEKAIEDWKAALNRFSIELVDHQVTK